MKKTLESSKKYLIVPVALGLVAIVALSSAHAVNARGNYGRGEDLSAAIAEKFGLNHEEVQVVVNEYHQQHFFEHHDEMTDRLADRLAMAVENGKITEAQMNALLDKHDEMYDRMVALEEQDLSVEDMRELRSDLHDELQAWAEENGIDMQAMMYAGKYMMGGSAHMGQGFHGGFSE